ncbi:MAG: HEAT repeat domain-containing protein [Candidatus Eremiobacterota bacterium]
MTLSELSGQLNSDITEVRRRAVVDISKMSGEDAFSLLVDALNDKDDSVRETAIYALADTKNPDSMKYLLKPKILLDANPNIRTAAIRALGNFRKIGGLYVIGELIGLCQDPEWFVRNTAVNIINNEIDVIKSEGDFQSVLSLLYILQLPDEEIHKKAVEALIETGKEEVDILISSLSSHSTQIKAGIVRVLGELKCTSAKEELIRLSCDEDISVREEVVRALGKIGGHEVITPLLKLMGDVNAVVREKAVAAMAAQGESVVEALIEALKHTNNKYKKKAIIEAIGKLKSEKALMALIDCLQDSHNLVRITAVNTLSEMSSLSSVQDLVEVLCINPIDIKELINMAVSGDVIRLKIRAIRALAELKDSRALPALTDMFARRESELLEKEILLALKKIKLAVWAKIGALQVLGRIKAVEALPVIRLHLNDADKNVICQALEAIKSMKASDAIEDVMALAGHREPLIRNKVLSVLGTIGAGNSAVTDIVIERLKDENREIRKEAARVLGKLNDKKATSPLEELIKTCDFWSVRRNACNALYNLGITEYSVDEEVALTEMVITCPYGDDADKCPVKYVVPRCVYKKV